MVTATVSPPNSHNSLNSVESVHLTPVSTHDPADKGTTSFGDISVDEAANALRSQLTAQQTPAMQVTHVIAYFAPNDHYTRLSVGHKRSFLTHVFAEIRSPGTLATYDSAESEPTEQIRAGLLAGTQVDPHINNPNGCRGFRLMYQGLLGYDLRTYEVQPGPSNTYNIELPPPGAAPTAKR